MGREQALALLDETWAAGSQAGNALLLRSELLSHVLAMEGERNGRVIIDTFVTRIEALIAGPPPSAPAHASPTLQRYAMAQLCALRSWLDEVARK